MAAGYNAITHQTVWMESVYHWGILNRMRRLSGICSRLTAVSANARMRSSPLKWNREMVLLKTSAITASVIRQSVTFNSLIKSIDRSIICSGSSACALHAQNRSLQEVVHRYLQFLQTFKASRKWKSALYMRIFIDNFHFSKVTFTSTEGQLLSFLVIKFQDIFSLLRLPLQETWLDLPWYSWSVPINWHEGLIHDLIWGGFQSWRRLIEQTDSTPRQMTQPIIRLQFT